MRRAVSFIAILALLALSVITWFSLSGPEPQPDGIARQIPRLGPGVFRSVAIIAGAAFAAALALAIVDAVRKRRSLFARKPGKKSESTFLVLFLVMAATVIVFTVVLAFAISLFDPEDLKESGLPSFEGVEEETAEEPLEPQAEPATPTAVETERRDISSQVLLVLGIAAAAVVAILAYGHIKSVRKANVIEDEESYRELREDLARSAVIGLDRILAEPDHRLAIIAAYAHMEATFADHGFPRTESQTPTEYMEATLSRIGAATGRGRAKTALPRRELLTLTGLYEVAKFSLHELTAIDRQSAMDSLRKVENSAPVVADTEVRG